VTPGGPPRRPTVPDVPVITLRGVSKAYSLGPPVELRRLLHRALAARPAALGGSEPPRLRYALRNLDLEVEPGESLGVIGRNGAGKTTLLRLLAGVTLPTHGRVRVEGRVASFIGLGMGFHRDLTGRENVHLYCALMGLDPPRIRARVEEIVSYAEIGDYVDVAVKRYSSGMMARLGFAAAVHVDPGILLLDEVLAVGDHRFRAKSLATLTQLVSRSTVVFVSHHLEAVASLCRRVIWLDEGRLRANGAAADIVAAYLRAQGAGAPAADARRLAPPASAVSPRESV
jgi:ABC-type polysaccharide/polyol phosphate transport system ATPase subunit